MNVTVVAEGMETQAQYEVLKHRCDEMQGYSFMPPVSADAFAERLRLEARGGIPDGLGGADAAPRHSARGMRSVH